MVKRRPAVRQTKQRPAGTKARANQRTASGMRKSGSVRPASKTSTSSASAGGAAKKKKKTPRPSRLTATARAIGRAVGDTAAAIASRMPWVGTGDAVDLLESDHRRLEDLLKAGEQTTSRAVKRRVGILKTITGEVTLHELIEEKAFYPALKSHAEAKAIVLEGYQEHHVADVLLKELHGLPPSDERWGAKFKVLKESLEHHIEEEEGNMFKTARSVLSRAQLVELATRMAEMKAEASPAGV